MHCRPAAIFRRSFPAPQRCMSETGARPDAPSPKAASRVMRTPDGAEPLCADGTAAMKI
jgi:hypothetical protein